MAFILEMVAALRALPLSVFAPNDRQDIYTAVLPVLGPYEGLEHRRAVMAEVLRVLAGFESSWRWNEGVDINNPASNKPETMEAGAWQVSANSRAFGDDLKAIAPADGRAFQVAMKTNHALAVEYIVRLRRYTINHNGPTKRHEIDPWLRRDAVAAFQQLLAAPASPAVA